MGQSCGWSQSAAAGWASASDDLTLSAASSMSLMTFSGDVKPRCMATMQSSVSTVLAAFISSELGTAISRSIDAR
jgi:hypothetical protein